MRFLALITLLTASSIAGEINLVAEFRTTFEEGARFTRIRFAAQGEGHHITLDTETFVEKLSDGTRFTFHKLPTSAFELRPSPAGKERPISPENLPEYRRAASTFLPPGAIAEEKIENLPDPHPINAWKTHRFIFDYKLNSYPFRMAVTFLTFPGGQQIALTTRASTEQFEASLARSDDLLRSWHTVPEGGKPKGGS